MYIHFLQKNLKVNLNFQDAVEKILLPERLSLAETVTGQHQPSNSVLQHINFFVLKQSLKLLSIFYMTNARVYLLSRNGTFFVLYNDIFIMQNTQIFKHVYVKFVNSEKVTKCCEISTLLLSPVHTDKSKVDISQTFVAFSEYMNFIILNYTYLEWNVKNPSKLIFSPL